MPVRKYITPGTRFNRLVVIEPADPAAKSGRSRVHCQCDCGNRCIVYCEHLRTGNTNSCGCFQRDQLLLAERTHGYSRTPIYETWCRMIGRCTNPKNEDFHHYGGRGIKVCERWSKFENFLADMGERPKGKTIERKDVNGDYEKNNCVWASWTEQQRNKRNNVIIEFNGKRQTAAAWAEELNLDHELICSRYRKGWPAEKVLLPPMKPWDCATGRK